jgi:hypothetical protein
MKVTRGKGPRAELAKALGWARQHRIFLVAEWKRLNERDD